MSELKVYHCNEWHNEYTEFYMKHEADKVIAEKDAEIGVTTEANRSNKRQETALQTPFFFLPCNLSLETKTRSKCAKTRVSECNQNLI